jgi:hypothetical protein
MTGQMSTTPQNSGTFRRHVCGVDHSEDVRAMVGSEL